MVSLPSPEELAVISSKVAFISDTSLSAFSLLPMRSPKSSIALYVPAMSSASLTTT